MNSVTGLLLTQKITCRPEEIGLKYNENGKRYRSLDGTVLKCCDHLAAFVEAYLFNRIWYQFEAFAQWHGRFTGTHKNKVVYGLIFGKLYENFVCDGKILKMHTAVRKCINC